MSGLKKAIFIINNIIIVVIVMLIISCKNNIDTVPFKCVPTEEEAIAIGSVICSKAYPELDLSQYELKCLEDEKQEEWIVFYHKDGQMGGLPEIRIKKDTAQVTFVALSK